MELFPNPGILDGIYDGSPKIFRTVRAVARSVAFCMLVYRFSVTPSSLIVFRKFLERLLLMINWGSILNN